MTNCYCPGCQQVIQTDQLIHSVEGKAACTVAGFALGAASEDLWVALGLAVVGALVGHAIDQEISPKCPWCGFVFKAIASRILTT